MLCTLFLGVSISAAAPPPPAEPPDTASARRQVAVIALDPKPDAEALANTIGSALVNHRTLGPLEAGAMIGALVGEYLDESSDKMAIAEGTRERAEKALADFVFPVAVSMAQAGHESLHTAVPTTRALAIYADLALILGKAKLGENRPAEANRYFALVHLLNPGRRLDPALHVGQVVQAFEASRPSPGQGTGRLVVKGSGNIHVDGKAEGPIKRSFVLAPGLHVVWLSGEDRETVGQQVLIEQGQETAIDLGESPASPRLLVQRVRVRLALHVAGDARDEPMRKLAKLLGVHDAVVIVRRGEQLLVQTWHDNTLDRTVLVGFSGLRIAQGEKPADLLKPLAPPPMLRPTGPLAVRRDELPRPWYRQRRYQAAVAAGVLAVVVGSVLISDALRDSFVDVDPNTSFVGRR